MKASNITRDSSVSVSYCSFMTGGRFFGGELCFTIEFTIPDVTGGAAVVAAATVIVDFVSFDFFSLKGSTRDSDVFVLWVEIEGIVDNTVGIFEEFAELSNRCLH